MRPLLLILLLLTTSPAALAGEVVITVLHTNDIHGHLWPGPDDLSPGVPRPVLGGARALAAVVAAARAERAEDGGVLLVDAGDSYHGSPEGDASQGLVMAALFERLGYDAALVGNHEFAYGVASLAELIGASKTPWLGLNIRAVKAPAWESPVAPLVERRIGGLRVVVLGVTTPRCASLNLPRATAGLAFDNPFILLPELVKRLSEEGAVVIVLSHMGSQSDAQLAPLIPSAAALIGAHDHVVELAPQRPDAPLYGQTGEYLRRVGRIDLRVSVEDGRATAVRAEGQVLNLSPRAGPPESELEADIAAFLEESRLRTYDVVVAEAARAFPRDLRCDGPTRLGTLVAEAVRGATGADAALVSYGSLRGGLPAGPLRLRDLYVVAPFDDPLRVLELKGAELVKAFRDQMRGGRLDIGASGISYRYDVTGGRGQRLTDIVIGGRPLDPEALYTLAVTEFQVERLLVERRLKPVSIRELELTTFDALLSHCGVAPDPGCLAGGLFGAACAERGGRPLGRVPEPRLEPAEVASPAKLWSSACIDINLASAAQLAALPWISDELAQAIVAERARRGAFQALSDLLAVPGVREDDLERLSRFLTVRR